MDDICQSFSQRLPWTVLFPFDILPSKITNEITEIKQKNKIPNQFQHPMKINHKLSNKIKYKHQPSFLKHAIPLHSENVKSNYTNPISYS